MIDTESLGFAPVHVSVETEATPTLVVLEL